MDAYRAMLDRKHAYGADAKKARGEAYLAKQEAKEARWARDAARRQAFLDSQKGIRTKGDIDRQKAEFQKEDEIEQWRKRGVRLGVLDDDFQPVVPKEEEHKKPVVPQEPETTRPTAATSHIPDVVVPTHDHVESVPMQHSIDHEEFHVPAMSSAFLAAIHHAERSASSGGIKVI